MIGNWEQILCTLSDVVFFIRLCLIIMTLDYCLFVFHATEFFRYFGNEIRYMNDFRNFSNLVCILFVAVFILNINKHIISGFLSHVTLTSQDLGAAFAYLSSDLDAQVE